MIRPVPVSDAAYVGERGGYDQVIIIARKVGHLGGEWVTVWGADETSTAAVNQAADFLKYKIMGWTPIPAATKTEE